MIRKYSCVPLSHSYKVQVDVSHHIEVNVFKSMTDLCVTLRNVTTEHLFLAVKHFFVSYSITFNFYMCTTVQNCAS